MNRRFVSLCVLFSAFLCHGGWVLWEPEAGFAYPPAVTRVELLLPADHPAGEPLELALRCVDVFGNVSATSETLRVDIPAGARSQGSPAAAERIRVPPLSGNAESLLPVPRDLRARFVPERQCVEMNWAVQQDIETLGVQILRRRAAAPVAAGQALVSWRFPESHPGEEGIPARLHLPEGMHPKLQFAELRIAEGYALEGNVFRNAYGIRLAGERWGDVADRPDRYVSIRLAPQSGETLRLHQLMIGLWTMDSGCTLEHRLTYSLDGFQTHAEIPLQTERPLVETGRRLGGGVPAHADLRAFAPLQGLRQAVEFRLYLWGTNEKGIGKMGIESTRENLPDLQIYGEEY